MKALLINPPLSRAELRNPVVASLFSNAMPLGILYIASYCISKGIEVKAIDGPAERLTLEKTMEMVKEYSPDVIGLTTTTPVFHRAIETAEAIRKWAPTMPIVVGGPHITAAPVTSMLHDCFDYGCMGEGEHTFYELCQALDHGTPIHEVPGLILHDQNGVHFTPSRSPLMDLDTLPFPARYLLNTKLYTSLPTDVQYLPKLTQLATRGCPFHCTFCDHAAETETYRTPSAKYMADELEELAVKYHAREVAFVGSTFTAKRSHAEELCQRIIDKKLNVKWTCSTRVDVINEDILRLMKQAGCWSLRFGIESGNQRILNLIKKGITKEQITKAVNLCDKMGIHTKAFFMVGHPGETIETLQETIDFACSIPLTDVTVQINTPLPNTHQFAQAHRYGKFVGKDYSKYSFFDAVFVPNGLTREDLLYYHKKFYRTFYWRPSVILRQIKKVSHWATLMNYLRCIDLILYLTLDVFKLKQPPKHTALDTPRAEENQ
ncbi:radical SAM protein [bacterium]|nr:radical SAM protein [bacterium]